VIHVVTDDSPGPFVAQAILEKAAAEALEQQAAALPGASPGTVDLTIAQTDDGRIQTLNREYLDHDAPTDVLSFPAREADPETGRLYLGDIIISTQRAAEQAREAGHSLEAEAQLLVVHGVLHLLGYDHAEPGEKARMWDAQAEILRRLGLQAISIRET